MPARRKVPPSGDSGQAVHHPRRTDETARDDSEAALLPGHSSERFGDVLPLSRSLHVQLGSQNKYVSRRALLPLEGIAES